MTKSDLDIQVFFTTLKDIYENMMPFNRLIGLKIDVLSEETVVVKIKMSADLIGNPFRGILHGGVISSVIDVVGGLTASVGLLQQSTGSSLEEIRARFMKMGTIDLRTDYLRPGHGETFFCSGVVLRTGNKVAVTRMEFKNEIDVLIAVGTGTYLVG